MTEEIKDLFKSRLQGWLNTWPLDNDTRKKAVADVLEEEAERIRPQATDVSLSEIKQEQEEEAEDYIIDAEPEEVPEQLDCPDCGDEFESTRALFHHATSVEDHKTRKLFLYNEEVTPTEYFCPRCGIVIVGWSELKKHFRSEHSSKLSEYWYLYNTQLEQLFQKRFEEQPDEIGEGRFTEKSAAEQSLEILQLVKEETPEGKSLDEIDKDDGITLDELGERLAGEVPEPGTRLYNMIYGRVSNSTGNSIGDELIEVSQIRSEKNRYVAKQLLEDEEDEEEDDEDEEIKTSKSELVPERIKEAMEGKGWMSAQEIVEAANLNNVSEFHAYKTGIDLNDRKNPSDARVKHYKLEDEEVEDSSPVEQSLEQEVEEKAKPVEPEQEVEEGISEMQFSQLPTGEDMEGSALGGLEKLKEKGATVGLECMKCGALFEEVESAEEHEQETGHDYFKGWYHVDRLTMGEEGVEISPQ